MYELVVIGFIVLGIAIVIGLIALLLWIDKKREDKIIKNTPVTRGELKPKYTQQPKKSFIKSAYYEWEQPKEKPIYNTAKDIGDIGEEKIKYILNLFLQENAGYVINDYRGCINGKTFQIDHVLITPHQILCIETKNYSGKIYGSYDNIEWTIVYNPNNKEKMYNPIRQNKNHINFLKNILGENTPIKNIVIFVGNANIEEIKEFKEIYTQFEFTNYLFNLNKNINPNYQYWYETLQTYKLNITNEEHIQNIKKFIYN